jgi:hypothetical protein
MSDTLDRLESLKAAPEYKAGYRGSQARYQWSQISYDDLVLLNQVISGLRFTVSCSDLRGLDQAINREKEKLAKQQRAEAEAELLDRMRSMQPAPAPAAAAPALDLQAMIKMAVEAALAVKAPAQPES